MHKRGKCTSKQDGGQGHRFHASIFIDDKIDAIPDKCASLNI